MRVSNLRARLVERVIVNYRLDPELLASKLPCSWLAPQVVRGSAIASFCILDLDQITVGPMPAVVGLRNVNCAHRFGAIDKRTGEPVVYVQSRSTNSRFASLLTKMGFPGRHGHVHAEIQHQGSSVSVEVYDAVEELTVSFAADAATAFSSTAFSDLGEFSDFIANGKRSYAPARQAGYVTIVDLFKSAPAFEPLRIGEIRDSLIESWTCRPALDSFDSVVRTSGGHYHWAYHGLEGIADTAGL